LGIVWYGQGRLPGEDAILLLERKNLPSWARRERRALWAVGVIIAK
jgi:hypothetical protein